MKRIVLSLILVFAASALFAYTDSFKAMQENPSFVSLMDAVKNGKSFDEAERAYDAYLSAEDNPLYLARMEYHMVRYYMDMGNKEMAEQHLARQKAYASEINDDISEVERLVLRVDTTSSEYYVTGRLGTGMENSNLVKELYKTFPDEYYAAIQEGFRLLYTPAIAGGSARRALRIFNDLDANREGASALDSYSILVGKAMALSETSSYDESDNYLDEAEKIFSFDNAVDEIRRDNRRGRRD